MSPRAATFSQADVARALRAAKKAGAAAVEVLDGKISILLNAPPIVPIDDADPFETWKRDNEARKAARRRDSK